MPKITEQQALETYNAAYQSAFFNGLYASAATFEDWRSWVWMPTAQEVRETRIVTSELHSLAQQLFGEGRPLTFTNNEFYELFVSAERRGLGFKVDRDRLREDQAGLYSNASFELGAGAIEFRWLFFWNLLCTSAFDGSRGFTSFDGATLISDSHPYRDENGNMAFWSNKTTKKLSRTAWNQAMEDYEHFRSAQGKTIATPQSFELIIGPKNKSTARDLFEADRVGGGDSNTVEKPSSWRVNRALRGEHAEKWFIRFRYADPKVAPVTFREDEAPLLRSVLDPTAESVRKNNCYEWWVEHKWGFGPGRPEALYGSDGSEA